MPLPSNFIAAQPALTAAAAASGSDRKTLVVLYLGGGIDCHSFVSPRTGTNRTAYIAARPNAVIADNPSTAVNADWQFHPQMTGLKALWDLNKVALVMNAGPLVQPTTKAQYNAKSVAFPSQLYSHSDQSALWASGVADRPGYGTGWLGRAAELLGPAYNTSSTYPPMISMSGATGLMSAFDINALGIGTSGITTRNGGSRTPASINSFLLNFFDQNLSSPDKMLGRLARVSKSAVTFATGLNASLVADTVTTVMPTNSPAAGLFAAARLHKQMATRNQRRSIIYLTQGGYDHHDDLTGTGLNSFHTKVTDLSAALKAYYDLLVELNIQNEVVTLVYSEFGRSLVENGNGSDHGWGGHSMLIGGSVTGGIYGTPPDLSNAGPNVVESRAHLLPTTPFESIYGTIYKWLGIPDATDNGVNPLDICLPYLTRFPTRDLGCLA